MISKNGKAPIDRDTQEQIELFERFLEAVKAGRQVSFTSTKTCLKMTLHDAADAWDEDREDRIKLIERTIAVLKAGYGSLTVTKGSKYFEFRVESNVLGALPPHNWASEDGGLLSIRMTSKLLMRRNSVGILSTSLVSLLPLRSINRTFAAVPW
jgi:hypothetical protein